MAWTWSAVAAKGRAGAGDAEQRRFVGDDAVHEVGAAGGEAEGDRRAVGVADEVDRREVECLDERGEVVLVLAARALGGWPFASGVTAAVVDEHAVPFGQHRGDELPAEMVGPAAVDQHEGVVAVAVELVVELDAVDALPRHGVLRVLARPEWQVQCGGVGSRLTSWGSAAGFDLPVTGVLGCVAAPGAGVHRVLEVAAEVGMNRRRVTDRRPDTGRHCCPCPLGC